MAIAHTIFAAIVATMVMAMPGAAQTPKEVTIGAFAGGFNLPTWVAEKKGFFAREGLAVKLTYTPRSPQLLTDIVDGKVQIYMGTLDNVVAYREGQGEAKVPEDFDLTVVFGLSSGFASVIAQPEIKSMAELKGKTLAVDAMTTGYAFVLREVAVKAGIAEGDATYVSAGGTAQRFRGLMERKFDATITLSPFDVIAVERGFNRLVGVEQTLGPYQGTVAAVRASWGRENRQAVVGFIRAYKAAVDWLYDRANRAEALTILAAGEKELSPAQLEKALDTMIGADGFYRDLKVNEAGARLVLALRSKYAKPQKTLTDLAKYIDTSFHAEAIRGGT